MVVVCLLLDLMNVHMSQQTRICFSFPLVTCLLPLIVSASLNAEDDLSVRRYMSS